MTYEEFKTDILNALENKPKWSRKGQFVFNYIDSTYNVARDVQFGDGVDCFYQDDCIEIFIIKSYERYKEKNQTKN